MGGIIETQVFLLVIFLDVVIAGCLGKEELGHKTLAFSRYGEVIMTNSACH